MRKSQASWRDDVVARAGSGALFGALCGLVLVGIGLLRAVIAVLSGRVVSMPEASDLGFVLAYVSGFAFGGAVVGGLWPLRRSWLGALLVGYLAAGIVCVVITVLILRAEGDSDPHAFAIVASIMTAIFGTLLAIKVKGEP